MHEKISKIFAFAVFLLTLPLFAEENSTLPKDSIELLAQKNDSKLSHYIALPLKYTVQPVIGALLYPTVPVVNYVFEEKVIDRTIDLFSLDSKGNFLVFPTTNVLLQQSSFFGLFLLYRDAFGLEGSRWVVNYKHMLNLDWVLKTDYGISDYLGTPLYGKFGYRHSQVKLLSNYSPIVHPYERHQRDVVEYYRSDSSYSLYHRLTYPLNTQQSLGVEFKWNQYLFDEVNENVQLDLTDPVVRDLYDRKLYENYRQLSYSIQWSRDSRESHFASTFGSLHNIKLEYSDVQNSEGFFSISGFSNTYWLLGNKRFQFSREEDRQAKRELRKFSFQKAIDFLRPEQLSEFLSERKVIVSYFTFRQVFAAGRDKVPLSGLNYLGWSTPLRGYSSNRIASEGYASWSLEYRWPVIDKLDGLVFNEYALPFKNPNRIFADQIRNSWGFGLRIRKPNFFFLRLQAGFHGLNGYALTASISPTYP